MPLNILANITTVLFFVNANESSSVLIELAFLLKTHLHYSITLFPSLPDRATSPTDHLSSLSTLRVYLHSHSFKFCLDVITIFKFVSVTLPLSQLQIHISNCLPNIFIWITKRKLKPNLAKSKPFTLTFHKKKNVLYSQALPISAKSITTIKMRVHRT